MKVILVVVLVQCVAFSLAAYPPVGDVLSTLNATKFLNFFNQANFASILATGGPYTILVPTDAAFNKVSAADMAAFTYAASIMKLLKYHVAEGETFSWDLRSYKNIYSLSGHVLRVYRNTRHFFFNQALVEKADIRAANAVIYLIDEVLDVPEGTIVQVLDNNAYDTSIFLDYLLSAHLVHNFSSTGSSTRYTVFAPSNAAFNGLPAALLSHINSSIITKRHLVEYHIHRGTLHADTLSHQRLTTMYLGHIIGVDLDQQNATVLNHVAHINIEDIEADNGVVHVISQVLIPSSFAGIGK